MIHNENRICAVLYHVNDISILFVCIYTPCDLFGNSSDYIYVISTIEALLAKYSSNYFVGEGDMNTDFSSENSSHTTQAVPFITPLWNHKCKYGKTPFDII